MNILITGSKGQLGNEMQLAAVRYPQFGYIFTDIYCTKFFKSSHI